MYRNDELYKISKWIDEIPTKQGIYIDKYGIRIITHKRTIGYGGYTTTAWFEEMEGEIKVHPSEHHWKFYNTKH